MKPKVYIETTVVSYLTAWPSRDLIRAAHQQVTREWWHGRRERFEVFVSQVVEREARAGDPTAASERLQAMEGIPSLALSEQAVVLAQDLVRLVPLPPRASADALHIALAAFNGAQYLLTWNCTHIANAMLRPKIDSICRAHGCEPPIICTPYELLEAQP